ncbi:uncharacterized protein J8A68_004465 [[Candida] subhashii]|uniref:Uncharacterized protein n=1 Tax=[Candida] subhashii TaxID=561895 RepID=A0A8J5QIY7_9ASCO|nr:uncharacterized protein J8A68_004465 [[Candida] subhashii]KAG7661965.1 hypothetical protein J8A68_004465 [[Candida] subhashii]
MVETTIQQPVEAPDLLNESKEQMITRYNKLLFNAAISGMLKGSLFALATGYYFSYKFNHPPYTRFFKPSRMVFWFVGWNVIGLTWSTDVAKVNITKQAALENEIKRNLLMEKEFAMLQTPIDRSK